MKTCTKCNQQKPLSEFHNCASKSSGKMSHCKQCRNSYNRKKAAEIGHDVLYRRAVSSNPEGYKQRSRDYYLKNRSKIIKRTAERRKADPERTKIERRKEYAKYKQKALENAKRWVDENPEKRKEIALRYARKVQSDPDMKPVLVARKMLSRILACTGKKKKGKTFDMLGYNKQELERHIESLFEDGMSWSNHGEWHIDHIVPVSVMVERGETDPAVINALDNLQPLWASENLSKGNKIL